MPVKMVALRRHYVSEARKEYDAGQSYLLHDKRSADKYERRLKAKREPEDVPDTRFPTPPARLRSRALTAETEAPVPTFVAPPEPVPVVPVEVPAPDLGTPSLEVSAGADLGPPVPRRYARRDMRSEEA